MKSKAHGTLQVLTSKDIYMEMLARNLAVLQCSTPFHLQAPLKVFSFCGFMFALGDFLETQSPESALAALDPEDRHFIVAQIGVYTSLLGADYEMLDQGLSLTMTQNLAVNPEENDSGSWYSE